MFNLHGMATGDSKATGFTINDRRAFTDEGDARAAASAAVEKKADSEPAEGKPPAEPLTYQAAVLASSAARRARLASPARRRAAAGTLEIGDVVCLISSRT